MPIFDIKCPACDYEMKDMLFLPGELVSVDCPECKKNGKSIVMVKQIGATNPHFKGDGFYETDYKKKDTK